jgi:succinate-semialdehyde dehydrogenase/glutarate-semialdehyde dehydrogenase
MLLGIAALVHRDETRLAAILTREQGKRLPEALQEVRSSADTFEWMAEEGKRAYGRIVPARTPDTDQLVYLEPVGPVAAFSPWNFPAVLGARKVATALAAGCTVVLKPAEETPGIWVALAALCVEAGLPAGVLNVIYGVPGEVSSRLIADPRIRKISFTGSVLVGRQLAVQAAAVSKRATLELGGHAPVIVTGDIDVERVVELTVAAKFRNAGQLCLCPTRFYVHDDVYDRFVARLGARAAALKVGDGADPDTDMGPLANPRRVDAMRAFCADAVQRSGRIVSGGKVPPGRDVGWFWAPTIIADVPDDARAMTEEPFGPLALVTRYSRLDDAIARANATEYGLAAYAFTRSLREARAIEHEIEAGSISLNTYAISAPEMPFSGVKSSGPGSEMGSEGLLDHLHPKAVVRAVA